MRDTMGWAGFHLLELLGLEEAQIEKYLKERGLFASGGPPGNQRATPPGIPKALRALLQNPMMLTIYAASCEVVERFKNSGLYQFKRQVETPGELLWNFMEAQVVKYDLHTGQDKRQKYFYKFLLRMILPALGYEMEKAGRFQLEGPELDVILVSYFKRFSLTEFFRSFPEYLDYSDAWDISGCDAKGILKKAYNILNILSGEMAMLVREGESYRFLHQNFRDFFVAVFILNEVEISFKRVEVAEVLTGGAISYYVRRYLGEIEGEHLNKPYLVEGLGWQIKSNESALLARALEMCRGKYGASYDNAVMNILESWKLLRGELSGLDFSRLDLSKVLFNNVRCSRLYEITYLASRFDESIIQKNTLFPGGHSSFINSAVYSSDGQKILSASHDQTVKEWDLAIGTCIQTYQEHKHLVNSAVYGCDCKKILSASWDQTVKEWDVLTGRCIRTYRGHTSDVNHAVYSRDCKKIVSASRDQTVKEWDVDTGKCIHTYQGHTSDVSSAVYSPDCKKILSASGDQTVKEWDVDTGKCIQTYQGHTSEVNHAVYNRDGKKIVSASYDDTVKEWDVDNGTCTCTYQGHWNTVYRAFYSRDGKKILSSSSDHTIKEWDAATGTCIRTYQGHDKDVLCAVYSPDGKKILSASEDQTVKEWDVATGTCMRTYQGYIHAFASVAYGNNGQKILSASWDHTVKEWNAATGKCIRTYQGHNHWVLSAVYSPDGQKILSASGDRTVKEWNAATGTCIRTYKGHASFVNSAAYSPDGQKILSASHDETVKEWDVETGKCLGTWKKKETPQHDSPDIIGRKLTFENKQAERDGNKIKITDRKTGENLQTFINIPGLLIQGCSFQNLHRKSNLTDENTELMKMYGATVSGKKNNY
ncbi:MAG: WD40 repeat domain-containing protein [bacterium]|nr:WD40 repeat domain-containing protein [bacterium]